MGQGIFRRIGSAFYGQQRALARGIIISFALLLLSAYAFAGVDQTIFGPQRCNRQKGAPTVYTGNFIGCNDGLSATLKITKSDSMVTRISSVIIYENVIKVASENDFNKQKAYFEKNITVNKTNEIQVILKSSSNIAENPSFLIIEIKGCSDITSPILANPQPAESAIINNNKPAISVQYADDQQGTGIDTSSVRMILDGNDVNAGSVVKSTSISHIPAENLADGPHTVAVYISDKVSNAVSLTGQFTIKTTAPVINITSPQNNQYLNTPTIAVTGTVNETVQSVTENSIATQIAGTFTYSKDNLKKESYQLTFFK